MGRSGFRRWLSTLLAALALLTGCRSAGRPAAADDPLGDPAKVEYPERLDLLRALAGRYPGFVEPGGVLSEYGMWAGIFLQTGWQQRTGRAAIPYWRLLNHSLSVEPTIYAAALDRARGKSVAEVCAGDPHVKAGRAPREGEVTVSRADSCAAWLAFFAGVQRGASQPELQHALWHAHTVSLVNRLREERSVVEPATATTPVEATFWANWFQIVFLLDALTIPTGGNEMKPLSDGLMPDCAPLGTPGCQVTPEDLGAKYGFVATLTGRPSSVDEIFRRYEAIRSNPVTAIAQAAADPALSGALAQVLALVGVPGPGLRGGAMTAATNPLCVIRGMPGC